ncbi:2,3-bisphosphoglycerate-independent phosphoglycerate mutase 1 [Porphyridium purpureum]|uniref:2,3-bisphosphoglycerate-independent phosphoglycerate mutase 1 n=1 Tax=Porphyridium purpureum TaxID=35688 RepID=A0A5J4Z4S8_PORPP|nr:2,3-bisphosphoglycerate-independent phosphoglycerate mutase 1 [Porphyridium purpureum]|eukprot:POR5058..scf295_1
MRRPVLLLVIDGVGDAGPETPLQSAYVPHLDAAARTGATGLMDPVHPGLACGSDTAHMAMFGIEPRRFYRGRGAFESMGAGIDMRPGDVAFKSNFATVARSSALDGNNSDNSSSGWTVVRRRADRNFEGMGPDLCAALDGTRLPNFPEVEVTVQYATEHRCGVMIRAPGLSDRISGTDPLLDDRPLKRCKPLPDADTDGAARRTSAIVNELSACFMDVLSEHPINVDRKQRGLPPANAVLLRGAGMRLDVPSFHELHGMRTFMIAPTKIIAGLGLTLDMHIVDVPGATGDYFTDLSAKGRATVEHLSSGQFDFGVLHIKAVDDAGHDRDRARRVEWLEKIDNMLGQIITGMEHLKAPFGLIVLGDHSTPVEYGDHSCEPVPVIASVLGSSPVTFDAFRWIADSEKQIGSGVRHHATNSCERANEVRGYDEISIGQHGTLGRFPGAMIIPIAHILAEVKVL